MKNATQDLIEVLEAAKELLARPENDFAWSSWADGDAAAQEINRLIAAIAAGKLPRRVEVGVLFAPTGPIQEVSLSSGWGQEFLALARRYDAIEKRVFGES